jgi:hypothetical protein
MDRPDPLHQHLVSCSMGGWQTTQPPIGARLRHAEHACHRRDREFAPVRAHEPEDPDISITSTTLSDLWPGSPAPSPAARNRSACAGASIRPVMWAPRGARSCPIFVRTGQDGLPASAQPTVPKPAEHVTANRRRTDFVMSEYNVSVAKKLAAFSGLWPRRS